MNPKTIRHCSHIGLTTVFLTAALVLACNKDDAPDDFNYRQEMRELVTGISAYSKSAKPGFLIIPQNGIELVSSPPEPDGPVNPDYKNAIDGNGQEDLFFGYDADDQATPADETAYLRSFLDLAKQAGKTILVTDYCFSTAKVDASYTLNHNAGYVSFAADSRELDRIPAYPASVYAQSNASITALSQVRNFLYLINPDKFASKSAFIQAVSATNYDLLIMDLFFHDGAAFTPFEIEQLQVKQNGGKRLVVSYLSIGEAEDYRYYWQPSWNTQKPGWLDKENPDWTGNYKVRYWDPDWQAILFGNDSSYVKRIIDAGFDGAYLDVVDGYEGYE